jgi:transposase-like protein
MGRPLKYTEEFRREAVELFLSGDRPRSKVAESLGIHDGSLFTRRPGESLLVC